MSFFAQLDTAGVFRDDGSSLAGIAVTGHEAPGSGGGTYSDFRLNPDINAAGEVAVAATVTGGTTAGGIFIVPEPSLTASLAIGALTLGACGRRRS